MKTQIDTVKPKLSIAQLARDLCVCNETLRNHAKMLDITWPPRKHYYPTDQEESLLRNSISVGLNKSYGVVCSLCNSKGHSDRYCSTHAVNVKCAVCGIKKSKDEFYTISDSKRKTKRLSSTCKECDKKRNSERYDSLLGRADSLLRSAKSRVLVSITSDYIVSLFHKQSGRCFYSNIPMNTNRGYYGFSLDRKDNNDGYTEGNVVLCCWIVNQMKREHSMNEFISLCKAVAGNHE